MSGFVVRVSGTPVTLTFQPNPVTVGATYRYTATVGTAGSKKAPVGTITLFTLLPDGTLVQADGPHAVTPNANNTSTFSDNLTAGSKGAHSPMRCSILPQAHTKLAVHPPLP